MKKILVMTNFAPDGGVATMLGCVLHFLKEKFSDITVTEYIPYSAAPDLSVPVYQVLYRKPSSRTSMSNGIRLVQRGVYLPEIELNYYGNNSELSRLIDEHDYHLVVSGSCLTAWPLSQANKPFLAWIATPYMADRETRMAQQGLLRRLLDRSLIAPIGSLMEREIVRKSSDYLLTLGKYTSRCFSEMAQQKPFTVLPFPIDHELFYAQPRAFRGNVIGFAGRMNDPRKNIGFLMRVLCILKNKIPDIRLRLMGGDLDPEAKKYLEQESLGAYVEILPYQSRKTLKEFYQNLDVFVIPSAQEGLCIAGLEAAACGCPIVSTRCGGPEEFVLSDKNGFLVDFDAQVMAEKIETILKSRQTAEKFSESSASMILERYSMSNIRNIFWENFNRIWRE